MKNFTYTQSEPITAIIFVKNKLLLQFQSQFIGFLEKDEILIQIQLIIR